MGNLSAVDMSDAEDLREGFKAIPPGEYQLYIESSEMKPNSKGTGEFLACVFVVAGGDYEGSRIFCNFNLVNSNADAVRIAKSQWRALCEATLGQPAALNNESSSLHNRIFLGLVDNVVAYNKETGKNDHPTLRTNELVFRKGTIRSIKEAAKPVMQTASQSETAPQPVVQHAPQATAPAATVKPGTGKPPWKTK